MTDRKEHRLAALLAGDDTDRGSQNLSQRQLHAIEKERVAIDRERQAIQQEREAIGRERRRAALMGADSGHRIDEEERRMLAAQRETVRRMQEELMKERERFEEQQRRFTEERLKSDQEVQMMASLAVAQINVLKEEVERMQNEQRSTATVEQHRREITEMQAAREHLLVEREELMKQVEELEKSLDKVLGIKHTSGEEGIAAERERVETERREREKAEIQLARATVERDKQEIEKIRVQIETIMKAWEAERDRQAKQRKQLDAEKEEVVAMQVETERMRRDVTDLTRHVLSLAGLQPATFAANGAAGGFLAQQPIMAGLAGLGSFPNVTSMTMGNLASSVAGLADSIPPHLRNLFEPSLNFTVDEHQATYDLAAQHRQRRGSLSQASSPVSTPPQPTSHPTPPRRKRKRGDSLSGAEPAGKVKDSWFSQESPVPVDVKRRRTVRPWEERFEELVQFKEKHGHLSVPAGGEHASLRIWVNNQKALHTKGTH